MIVFKLIYLARVLIGHFPYNDYYSELRGIMKFSFSIEPINVFPTLSDFATINAVQL